MAWMRRNSLRVRLGGKFGYYAFSDSEMWVSLGRERARLVCGPTRATRFHVRFPMVRLVALLVALLSLKGLSPAAEVSRSQPNIVIFITDDESWQDRSSTILLLTRGRPPTLPTDMSMRLRLKGFATSSLRNVSAHEIQGLPVRWTHSNVPEHSYSSGGLAKTAMPRRRCGRSSLQNDE